MRSRKQTILGLAAGLWLSHALLAQQTGVTIFAVTASNRLVSFNSGAPGTLLSTTPITGLQPGESILGIDYRPRTGQLYGLGSTSRIYTINTTSGAATQVGVPLTTALNGTAFGFDISYLAETIRVVSDAEQNIRVNPGTAVVSGDSPLTYAAGDANAGANPQIAAAAYTYGLAAITLFAIDSNLDILVMQGSPSGAPISPNSGQLFTAGPLGVNVTGDAGFDIDAVSGTAFASFTLSGGATSSSLYTINLATGAAGLVGTIGGGELIRGLAVATPALNLASVSAASFSGAALAPESIATAFGQGLATGVEQARVLPLSTSMLGTTVRVRDSAGIERLAPLLSVGPSQVNYLIPAGTAPGPALVTNTSGTGTVSRGVVHVEPVFPGLFSANMNGREVAAAWAFRVKVNGERTYEPVAQFDSSISRFASLPVDLGPETDQVFLLLYGTGARFRSSLDAVTVAIGGESMPVSYAGEVAAYPGLDQINVLLTRNLIGRGEMDVVMTVDGKAANTVRINIK